MSRYYWAFAIILPVVVASLIEIVVIYWDCLLSAMKFVAVVGLQLLPLDDSRLFITLSLTRAVLELGNPNTCVCCAVVPMHIVWSDCWPCAGRSRDC